MAGGRGFEPRLTESESAVLPLNYPPTKLSKTLGFSPASAMRRLVKMGQHRGAQIGLFPFPVNRRDRLGLGGARRRAAPSWVPAEALSSLPKAHIKQQAGRLPVEEARTGSPRREMSASPPGRSSGPLNSAAWWPSPVLLLEPPAQRVQRRSSMAPTSLRSGCHLPPRRSAAGLRRGSPATRRSGRRCGLLPQMVHRHPRPQD